MLDCFHGPNVYFLLKTLGFTTWLCVSPQIVFVLISPLCLLYPACYYVITKISNQNSLQYRPLQTDQDEKEPIKDGHKLTKNEKFTVIKTVFATIAVPMYVITASKTLAMQAIVTTIAFPNTLSSSRDFYQYYYLSYQAGEVLGRSNRLILANISSYCLYPITKVELWVLVILQVLHLFTYYFESWYRFLPNYWTFLALCFSGGLCAGIFYNNCLELLSLSLSDKESEFGLAYASRFMDIGALSSSLIGLHVETKLREHCSLSSLIDRSLCLTRASSINEVVLKCRGGG